MDEMIDFFNKIPPEFRKPLDARESKKYHEIFALLTMQHFYPHMSANLVLKDSPDLQDLESSLGIEVTRIISPYKAKISGEFVKYRLNKKTRKHLKKFCKIAKDNGGKVLLAGGGIIYPSVNECDELGLLESIVIQKGRKIASYRGNGFNKLGLFVIYDSPMIPVPPIKIKSIIDSALSGLGNRFDFIILCDSGTMIHYDLENGGFSISPYPRNVRESICQTAFCTTVEINSKNLVISI